MSSRERSVGAVPPNRVTPSLLALCTNGGRHKPRELLRVVLLRGPDGAPQLAQPMSPQQARDGASWTVLETVTRAADGHQVIRRKCPLCRLDLQLRVDKLTADLARARRSVSVDVSGGTAIIG